MVLAVVLLTGCVYPHKVHVAGPILSADSIAFLGLKDATRAETIATLGPPVWESKNSRVLLYLSQTTIHWIGEGIGADPVSDPDHPMMVKPFGAGETDSSGLTALFVAYDKNGLVTSHLAQRIRTSKDTSYEDLCEQYAQRATKP